MRASSLRYRFAVQIISDSKERAEYLLHSIGKLGLNGEVCSSAKIRDRKLEEGEKAVAIVESSGLHRELKEVTAEINELLPEVQILVLIPAQQVSSSHHENANVWYLISPFEEESFFTLVTKACIMYELKREKRELQIASTDIVFSQKYVAESDVMKSVEKSIKKIARLDSSLLLTGESGTGKTLLAHQVHEYSPRRNQAFVTMSCAAIPRELLEAELFGHTKGSFTGAHTDRAGSLELADGGTLFLDEIGELPLELQPKLLNVLQDRKFRRVGGNDERSVDVRVITATNRNLEEMCQQGLFREDLYYRINVLQINVPPLRDRTADIPDLCSMILKRIATQRGEEILTLSAPAEKLLIEHSWPGNVRELENALERASAFCEHGEITPRDLDFIHDGFRKASSAYSLVGMTLAEIEARAINETLAFTHGNKAEAAKMLGISLKSVYNKLEKLGSEA
ncbi:MAG: sigma-54-dependent Fis family transcriptional regulator [Bdellovibrionales bacterium]|nr:sigma-54-dependent Fis family transcriptional regulator [Bdellovibrionales bacterium]